MGDLTMTLVMTLCRSLTTLRPPSWLLGNFICGLSRWTSRLGDHPFSCLATLACIHVSFVTIAHSLISPIARLIPDRQEGFAGHASPYTEIICLPLAHQRGAPVWQHERQSAGRDLPE